MKYLSLLFVFFWMLPENEHKIDITISNIQNHKGNISIAVFTDQVSYEDKKPFFKKIFPKKNYYNNGDFNCSISLPEGRYGIAILDDENKNKKMDYNFFGIPTEGYGFSNFIHKSFSKPSFPDFDFDLKNDKKIKVKLRYF